MFAVTLPVRYNGYQRIVRSCRQLVREMLLSTTVMPPGLDVQLIKPDVLSTVIVFDPTITGWATPGPIEDEIPLCIT